MTRDPYPGWQLDPDPLVAPEPDPPPRRSPFRGCLPLVAIGIVAVWVLW